MLHQFSRLLLPILFIHFVLVLCTDPPQFSEIPLDFEIYEPYDGMVLFDPQPDFSWKSFSEGVTYLEVYIDDALATTITDISQTLWSPEQSLAVGEHSWYLILYNNFERKETAHTPFFIAPLIHSSDQTFCPKGTPQITWEGNELFHSYEIELSSNGEMTNSVDFSNSILSEIVTESTFSLTSDLIQPTLYWHIRGLGTYNDTDYQTPWSDVALLIENVEPPLPVMINTPTAICLTQKANFSWELIPNHVLELQITDDVDSFEPSLLAIQFEETNQAYAFSVPDDTSGTVIYTWRARFISTDSACVSDWTSVKTFEVHSPPVVSNLQAIGATCFNGAQDYIFSWEGGTVDLIITNQELGFTHVEEAAESPFTTPMIPGNYTWQVLKKSSGICSDTIAIGNPISILEKPAIPVLVAASDCSSYDGFTDVLSWTAVTAETYQIELRQGPLVDEATCISEIESYDPEPNLEFGTWIWAVQACNDMCCSDWSTSDSFQVSFPNPELNPTDSCEGEPVLLNWTSTAQAQYQVDFWDGSIWIPTSISSTNDEAVYAGTPAPAVDIYKWRIQTEYDGYTNDWSESDPYTIHTAAQQPTALNAEDGVVGDSIQLSWDNGSGFGTYTVEIDYGSGWESNDISDITSTGALLNATTTGTFPWRVQHSTPCGMEENNSTVIVETACTPPTPPTLADISSCGSHSILFSFTGGSGADSYTIEVLDGGSTVQTYPNISTTLQSYIIEDAGSLSPGTYTWQILAHGTGCDAVSGEAGLVISNPSGSTDTFIQKIIASDVSSSDQFGKAVAMDGTYIVIGAPGANAVYVFEKTGDSAWDSGTWVEQQKISGSTTFGSSVAIDGLFLAVGSPSSNEVVVYERIQTDTAPFWVLNQTLSPYDGGGGGFGTDVALYEDRLVVGAPTRTGGGGVYGFWYDGSSWIADTPVITSSDIEAGDEFGEHIDLYGDFLIAGAEFADGTYKSGMFCPPFCSNTPADVGAAYVFEYTTQWNQQSKLTPYNLYESTPWFGNSVAIYESTAMACAPHQDRNSSCGPSCRDKGSAQFTDGSTWTGFDNWSYPSDTAVAYDRFGISASMYNSQAIIGAENSEGLYPSGVAYLFDHSTGSTWVQSYRLIPSDGNSGDAFGYAVDNCGCNAVAGAPNHDPSGKSNAGAVYIYD